MDAGARGSGDQRGFTVAELAVTLSVLAVAIALSVPPLLSYMNANDFGDAVAHVAGDLDRMRERSVAEATASQVYGVDFTPGSGTYRLFRSQPSNVVGTVSLGGGAFVESAACTPPGGPSGSACYFYGRGTASGGTVIVAQKGSNRRRTLTIESLTGVVRGE